MLMTGCWSRIWLFLAGLAAAVPQARASQPEDEAAYRATFSAENLGSARPGPSVVQGFTMHYRGAMPNSAFAMARAEDGRSAWGLASGRPTPDAAQQEALRLCRDSTEGARGGPIAAPCVVVAVNGRVNGRPPLPPQGPAAIGPFRPNPWQLWRGPEAARGVVVWQHGYEGPEVDLRGNVTPGFVSALNNAGWDVLRFDRPPGDDALHTTLPLLVNALPLLRPWRQVVLAGHSRGAWQSLLAAAQAPGLVDGIIAAAPAAHGEVAGTPRVPVALADFRRHLAGLGADRPALLVLLFENDQFDPDAPARAAAVNELSARRAAPTLAIFPRGPAQGHNGVFDWRFTRDFAACVLTAMTLPQASAPRGVRRDSCGGG
jgi:pimeloyl-ACP methyl ester carboxylesterase